MVPMSLGRLRAHLNRLADANPDLDRRPVVLTDTSDTGEGYVYTPVEVDLLAGESDVWISIDITDADL